MTSASPAANGTVTAPGASDSSVSVGTETDGSSWTPITGKKLQDTLHQPFTSTARTKKCLIIYTGGTIGMVADSNQNGTLIPSSSNLPHILATFNELQHADVPCYDILIWPTLYDSSDIGPAEWTLMARQIAHFYLNYDGFVILHGTDTLSYTAAALSFMLENLNKPVILSGSMIPLNTPVSDAKKNLILSIVVSCTLEVYEVCIVFGDKLHRGNRCTKANPASVDAFESPNYPVLALMGVNITLNTDKLLPAPRRQFKIDAQPWDTRQILVMSMIPGFDPQHLKLLFAHSSAQQPMAVVLSLFGSGNIATRNGLAQQMIPVLKQGIEQQHVEVVVVSQCQFGAVDMLTYAAGREMYQLGAINGLDLTLEACVTKLGYLMGKGLRKAALKRAMECPLRGELTINDSFSYSHGNNVFNANIDLVNALVQESAAHR